MPAKSKAQLAFINANRDKLEKQGMNVDEWNESSKGLDLPERVMPKYKYDKKKKKIVKNK